MGQISDLVAESYGCSKRSGFHDTDNFEVVIKAAMFDAGIDFNVKQLDELVARIGPEWEALVHSRRLFLVVSELVEAFEVIREGKSVNEVWESKPGKKEGVPIELADAVIRIMDMSGSEGIDLETDVEQKIRYNYSRPKKHGKSF